MGVTLGIYGAEDATGWTTFTASEPSGEGSGFSGAGTRKIYVSASGNDSTGTGTQAAPLKTIAAGMALLRNGSPDWLLFKKGDTWTDETFGFIGKKGLSANEPMRISSYGTGNQPLFKVKSTGNGAPPITISSITDYLAITDLHFKAYKRDPNDPGFDPTHIGQDSNWNITGISSRFGPKNWILLEGNTVQYFDNGVEFVAGNASGTLDTLIIRRNIVSDCYTCQTAHGGGYYIEAAQHLTVEENITVHIGWSHDLYVPATITMTVASPTVVTWVGAPLAEGHLVQFHSTTGALPTGVSIGTPYFVKNKSGDTFNLSTTRGGSTLINTSGSQSGTHKMIFEDVAPTVFNHCYYIQMDSSAAISVAWPVTYRGNINMYPAGHGAECIPGGEVYNNLCLRCCEGLLVGKGLPTTPVTDNVSNVFHNVILEGIAMEYDPYISGGSRALGIGIGSNTGTVNVTRNIVAHQAQTPDGNAQPAYLSSSDITKAVFTNNIFYNWRNSGATQQNQTNGISRQSNQASGNTYSPNDFDPSATNAAGYPDPTRSIGAYLTSISIAPATADQYLTELRSQHPDTWRASLMAHRVNDYIRGGFGQRRRLTVNWNV